MEIGQHTGVDNLFASRGYEFALHALSKLPDRCAPDVNALATRIGADKLDLITWARRDLALARLIASKVAT
jgi:hypothetical protein